MRKLRVAIVAPSLGILGGQAVQANRLIEAWRDDPDVDAWLVPVNPEPPALLRWTKRVKYARTLATEAIYGPLLVRELARADVVHVFSASYSSFLLAPLPALVVARALGRPVVLNYRSGEAPDHLARSPLARAAIASVNANIVPSQYLVDVFKKFGITASVIPNLVDLSRFPFRRRNPLQPRLVSTRNFAPLYNVACTLRAFRLVQDRWPDATLTLVGGGPAETELRALAQSLGLKHVCFAGQVNANEIARHYRRNDIYVQSPNIDNMPTSVIEAFACGLPVASTDAGGVPAILTDGVHGLLAPVDDHRTLAAQILKLLDDPELASRLSEAAYATCQGCTWSAVRDRWLDAYRRVLPESAAQAVGHSARRRARPAGRRLGPAFRRLGTRSKPIVGSRP
jgi:glycosyltransferase involved in cell wall biosynthesis